MVVLLTLALLAALAMPAGAGEGGLTVAGLELRGATSFATGLAFGGTEVGGLSGITYDGRRRVYYALSDDRSQKSPARFYTLAIDLADGSLDAGDVRFLKVTFLRDRRGATLAPLATDPEGIFLVGPRRLCISSEGDAEADPPIDPFVRRFKRRGRQTSALTVPDKFLPDAAGTRGVRVNQAFESLTSPPDRGTVITATEAALLQDGPATDVGQPSLARILELDLRGRKTPREYVYVVEPVAEAPDASDAFRTNGLVELLALDGEGTFLALERSFTVGKGNTVILYEISTAGATDVAGYESLLPGGSPVDFEPVGKRRLLDLGDLGVVPDNLEAMAFGPPMADGRLPLILVSDNNFSKAQETQFILLGVELEERGADRGPGSD